MKRDRLSYSKFTSNAARLAYNLDEASALMPHAAPSDEYIGEL